MEMTEKRKSSHNRIDSKMHTPTKADTWHGGLQLRRIRSFVKEILQNFLLDYGMVWVGEDDEEDDIPESNTVPEVSSVALLDVVFKIHVILEN